jgi:hypothetical protein
LPDPQPPADAPAPAFVTREELASTADGILNRIQGLFEGYNARAPQGAPHVETPEPPINLAEIDEAIASGQQGGAMKIAKLIDRVTDDKVKALRRTEIDPLRTYGLDNMGVMARDMALRDMPEKHKKYQKEIDAFVGAIPDASVRANPEAWKHAYRSVLGQHHDELTREAVEEAIRKEAEVRSAPAPASAAFLDDEKKTPLPSVEEFAGAEGQMALREKRMDSDAWAQRAGYANWKDYMKMAVEFDPARQFDADNPHELYPSSPKSKHARR